MTTEKKLTRNQRYEQKMKEQGFIKRTYWIPPTAEVEMKQTADFLRENRDHIPYMVRSTVTGRMAKCV